MATSGTEARHRQAEGLQSLPAQAVLARLLEAPAERRGRGRGGASRARDRRRPRDRRRSAPATGSATPARAARA